MVGTYILGSWRSPIDKAPAYVLRLHMFGGSSPNQFGLRGPQVTWVNHYQINNGFTMVNNG